jgi:hypothetical protein
MAFSHTAGLDLPAEFDAETYDALNARAAGLANPNAEDARSKNVAQIFAAAWNGVAFRLRAAFAYDEEFRASIAQSVSPLPPERFIQERAFFGCAVSALSAVECFFMASYAMGAAGRTPSFPIATSGGLKKEPSRVAAAFLADYPLHAFSKIIKDVIDSQGLRDLKAVRNVLAHRGTLPRRHFQVSAVHRRSAIPANPQELGVDFDYASNLDDELTRKHCQFAVTTLNKLMKGLSQFIA